MIINFSTQLAERLGIYSAIIHSYLKKLVAQGAKDNNGWYEYKDDNIKFLIDRYRKMAIKKLVKAGYIEVNGNLFKLKK